MKILHICSARKIGGGERHVADLTNLLAKREHDVYVAVLPSSPLLSSLRALPKQNIFTLRKRSALSIAGLIELSRFIVEQQIEIIHAHAARDYMLAVLAARCAKNAPKLILTRHVLFPLKKIHKLTLRHTARVIAVSQAVADSLIKQNIFEPGKIVLIHNGVDANLFACNSVEQNRKQFHSQTGVSPRFLVGMVGDLAPIKGQDDFIRAAAIIVAQQRDVDFVIAGEDKSRTGENRARLERLVSQLGLTERVHFTGWLDDVKPLLSALDLFVSPSRYESFGLAMIEAMASRVPVIATKSEGAMEIIEDGETGKLVPIGNVELLAQTMRDLLSNKEERERLGARALISIQRRFSLDRMVDATEALYQRVLNESKSRSSNSNLPA